MILREVRSPKRRPNDPIYCTEKSWLGREGSNLRMAESKSAALPLGYAPTGFWKRRQDTADSSSVPPVYRGRPAISTGFADFDPLIMGRFEGRSGAILAQNEARLAVGAAEYRPRYRL